MKSLFALLICASLIGCFIDDEFSNGFELEQVMIINQIVLYDTVTVCCDTIFLSVFEKKHFASFFDYTKKGHFKPMMGCPPVSILISVFNDLNEMKICIPNINVTDSAEYGRGFIKKGDRYTHVDLRYQQNLFQILDSMWEKSINIVAKRNGFDFIEDYEWHRDSLLMCSDWQERHSSDCNSKDFQEAIAKIKDN
jgi:hypothetical protein